MHTGVAEERDGDCFGPPLNRVARLQAIGHGQQTLLSEATYQRVCDSLPEQVTLLDKGQHRLKDLLAPEHVWQLLHPALPTEFPPLKSLDYLSTHLPRQMTSFIDREQEMVEVKRLLSSTPLLTLLGIGGAGKTRLALQVGAEMLDAYKDGVWLVELAALAESDLVPQTVAAVWGLREESLAIRRELGDKKGIAKSLNNLGNVAKNQGDYATVRALLAESLAICRELSDLCCIAWNLEELAGWRSDVGDPLHAVRIWGASQRLRDEIGSPLSPNEQLRYEPRVAGARAAIGDDAFDAAWTEGLAMTLEQAIESALQAAEK